MVAQLAPVLRDQSRVIEDAMKHLQRLAAEFRRLFDQHAAQTKRMTPDQGAHPGRATANNDYIVIGHMSSTERRRDGETERRRDRMMRCREAQYLLLSVPLSLCLHSS